jgi:hypothetical protein
MSWDLLTSAENRGVTEIIRAVLRFVGTLHYWPILAFFEFSSSIFLPHLAWSFVSMRKFSLAVMESSRAVREKDPSIKDVFGIFNSAKDPETGEPALTPTDVRRNTANFIIAGEFVNRCPTPFITPGPDM